MTTADVPFASAAARSGEPFVETPTAYDAILLASFGGPEGQDDVIPFLRNVTRGRGIPDERLELVSTHYRSFGGVSPINGQNRVLLEALEAEIARRGLNLPVYWGNRNWHPMMDDAVTRAYADDHRTVLALATSAYSSYSSDRQYREDFARVLGSEDGTGLGEGDDPMTIDKIRLFFDHPGFVEPFYEGIRDAIGTWLKDGRAAREIRILFSTHSVPMGDANKSGPRDAEFGEGGAYVAQHKAVAEYLMARLRDEFAAATDIDWSLVFQSRSGPPSQPWLEPDINDVIAELPGEGITAVAVVPLGFVSDHMEVLWDLDNEAKQSAADAGLAFARTRTPGAHPAFVSGLVDLIEERLNGTPASERPHVTPLGPWYDVSRPGSDENERLGFRPAAAGLAP
ncbi:ferrochelatase [Microbacterium sorbitolivorans]|uniref:Coproporphyrin III ferrochelatase n=1 Tax=Microbacterium sorbitolivorans TaxID=1867410 RepID=A0A367Y6L2_9MICO|nr:ferrochelatase [Microbacterium sorbitolivorans]RCK61504.1 ferrochelatase [Microbacterium sorbitolivorans]GGF31625.1 ferrochelatase [Microbacterium sorbitolivorans]